MPADPQSPGVDERPFRAWLCLSCGATAREPHLIHDDDLDQHVPCPGNPDGNYYVEVVPASLVASYRDAFAEIAEARSLDEIMGILANGPLATAPGGPKEDECFRLRAERDALRAEVETWKQEAAENADQAERAVQRCEQLAARVKELEAEKSALLERGSELTQRVIDAAADGARKERERVKALDRNAISWEVEMVMRSYARAERSRRQTCERLVDVVLDYALSEEAR